jgi:hypothetical protein
MFKKSFLSLAVAASFSVFSLPASADIFVWQDPEIKLSITYPDRWERVLSRQPDELFTVAAPGKNDHAICRLRTRSDHRFAIYPPHLSRNVQHLGVSYDFWESYVGEYDNAVLHKVSDNVALGRGFGSYADASYFTATGPKMQKRGLMFASLYNNTLYVLDCSAEASAYHKWHDSFLSVAKSVDFRKEIHELPNGDYRTFWKDPKLKIHGLRDVDAVYY